MMDKAVLLEEWEYNKKGKVILLNVYIEKIGEKDLITQKRKQQ